MTDVDSGDLTDGPILRSLMVLSLPILTQNFVQVGQQMVDILWLGRYSGEAVAAVGIATPVYVLLMAFAIAAPVVGTLTVASQRVGSSEADPQTATSAGLVLTLTLGVVGGAAVYFGVEPLVDLIVSVDPTSSGGSTSRQAVAYLEVLAFGILIAGVSDVVEVSFIAWGDSQSSLYMNVTAFVANLVLDPILIFGWGPLSPLGIRGAAIATVVGHAAGLALGVWLAVRNDAGVLPSLSSLPDLATIRTVLKVGSPQTGKEFVQQTAQILVVVVAFVTGGPAGTAAFIVGDRVSTIARVPAYGLKQATQSMVGQNVGANAYDRAATTTYVGVAVAVGLLAVIGGLQFFFARPFAGVLLPAADSGMTTAVTRFLRLVALSYPAVGAYFVLQGGFDGVERTQVTFLSAVVQYWVVMLPIAFVFGIHFEYGLVAVFWAVALANVAVAALLGTYFFLSVGDGLMRSTSAT